MRHKRNQQVHSVNINVPSPNAPKEKFPKCWICKSDANWPDQCEKFINMKVEDRFEMTKNNHACFSCLKIAGRNHRSSNCSRKKMCCEKLGDKTCDRFHHRLLHLTKTVGVNNLSIPSCDEPLLCVLEVEVKGKDRTLMANVMLDLGSQGTFVRSEFAQQLGVKGKSVAASITKVGGAEESFKSRVCELKLVGCNPNNTYNIKALEMPMINQVEKVNARELEQHLYMSKNTLERRGGPIDILIGVDNAYLMTGDTRKVNGLVALKSPLGWAVFGGSTNTEMYNQVMNVTVNKPVNLDASWTVESMGVDIGNCDCNAAINVMEDMEAKLIEDSSTKVGNQWLIPYPWAKDPSNLPDNKWQAQKMLSGLEKRLLKNEQHGAAYKQQMKEMVDNGFATKLTKEEIDQYNGPVHYLPHHAVIRAENKSTPVRIVFNSANKCNGESINDYWLKGPDLLNKLHGVLLRFREREVAVCGDISKMYHRILIPEVDQHVHRYLWRDLECDREPDTYIMKVLTFGDKPAAAMAQTALRLTAKTGMEVSPKVSLNDTYMDDICTSVSTTKEARSLTEDLDKVLCLGGFRTKGWLSNKQLNDKEVDKSQVQDCDQKVLGVTWNYKEDTFRVDNKPGENIQNTALTKRKALGIIAQVFDPIGFLAPVVVKLKIKMQELWQSGVNWDEDLPEQTQKEWKILLKELALTNEIKLPRCLTPTNSTNNAQLIIFCDASEKAYGACAYLRWKLQDGTFKTRFITAKSRVAPLKKLTVPRWELQAAVIAARMGKSITEESSLSFTDQVYFTDSMIVLGWINKPSCCYKQFVSARVLEIQNKTKIESWRHVPGTDNPADDVSRGIPVENLQHRWIEGPKFLKLPMCEWTHEKPNPVEDESEIKIVRFTGYVEVNQPNVCIEECRTWEEMLEIYRQKMYGSDSPALDVHKIRDIELLLLRRVQKNHLLKNCIF